MQQQKLMSYQIFTELFKPSTKEPPSAPANSAPANPPIIRERKSTNQIIRQSEPIPPVVLQASIPSQAKSEMSSLKDQLTELNKSLQKRSQIKQPTLKKQTVKEPAPIPKPYVVTSPPPAPPKQPPIQQFSQLQMKLREQLISQDDSIRKLLDEKDELEGMLRGYEQQLSTKEKEYDAFREIISNMEEDIMEFRSQIKKGELEAKEQSEKHAKEVAALQQQLNQLKQTSKESKVKHQLILKDKESELQSKQIQLAESIDTNSRLLDELIVLRKDKDIRKQQIDKQHQLIIQYEKRNQQATRQIQDLSEQLTQLRQQVSRYSSNCNSHRGRNNSNSFRANQIQYTKPSRSSSIPIKRCETNLKAKLFSVRKELAEIKESIHQQTLKTAHQMQLLVQSVVANLQALYQSRMTGRNEQLETLRKEMIRLKVEVFELQLKQQSVKRSSSRQNYQTKQTEGFWMAKLLESSKCLEKQPLNTSIGQFRQTSLTKNDSMKKSSARKMGKQYDVNRKKDPPSTIKRA